MKHTENNPSKRNIKTDDIIENLLKKKMALKQNLNDKEIEAEKIRSEISRLEAEIANIVIASKRK